MSSHTMHGKQVEIGEDCSPDQNKLCIFGFGVRLRRCEEMCLRKCEQRSKRESNKEREREKINKT